MKCRIYMFMKIALFEGLIKHLFSKTPELNVEGLLYTTSVLK